MVSSKDNSIQMNSFISSLPLCKRVPKKRQENKEDDNKNKRNKKVEI